MALQARSSSKWQSDDVYETGGKTYWTERHIFGRGIVPHSSLYRWKKAPCRYLKYGRSIRFLTIARKLSNAHDRVTVFLASDVQRIEDRLRRQKSFRANRDTGLIHKDDRGEWLTRTQFVTLYPDVSRIFLEYWSKRPTKVRTSGNAIRSMEIPNPRVGLGNIFVPVYLRSDIEECLACKESRAFNFGNRGTRGARIKAKLDDDARKWLKGILRQNGPLLLGDVLARAADQSINAGRVYRARTALGVKSHRNIEGKSIWTLPTQELPAESTWAGTAKAMLDQILQDGYIPYETVKAEAQKAGLKMYLVARVARENGIVAEKVGMTFFWRTAEYRFEPWINPAVEQFLRNVLGNGPILSEEILEQARLQGIGRNSLGRFARLLGIVVQKQMRTTNSKYEWRPPAHWVKGAAVDMPSAASIGGPSGSEPIPYNPYPVRAEDGSPEYYQKHEEAMYRAHKKALSEHFPPRHSVAEKRLSAAQIRNKWFYEQHQKDPDKKLDSIARIANKEFPKKNGRDWTAAEVSEYARRWAERESIEFLTRK